MRSNEGHVWVYLGGVGHVELSEGFFGLKIILCGRRDEDPGYLLSIHCFP